MRGEEIELKGTEFQIKVWMELMKIPTGETRSYKEVAGGAAWSSLVSVKDAWWSNVEQPSIGEGRLMEKRGAA